MFPQRVETNRLRFEQLCRENVDVRRYYRLCSRHEDDIEEATARLPWSPHESPKETSDYLRSLEDDWNDGVRAEYVIRPKDGESGNGEVAGAAGLHFEWERRTANPGIWLRKPFWGRGYSGERADALLELAFEHLDLDLVAVPTEPENEKSRRAIEKYVERHGGQYDGLVRNATRRSDGRIVDYRRYTVTREQYESSDGAETDVHFQWE